MFLLWRVIHDFLVLTILTFLVSSLYHHLNGNKLPMPFTIGGEWIPDPSPTKQTQPIKVRKEKRRSSFVTIIMHLPYENPQLKNICSTLKKQIGCGGSVKGDAIELQGDQIDAVNKFLKEL